MTAQGDIERDYVVKDLSSPVRVSEKDRGLQVTISLDEGVEKSLEISAGEELQKSGASYVRSILIKAQGLASAEEKDLPFKITSHHIAQATLRIKDDWGTKVNKRSALRGMALTFLGAALGLMPSAHWLSYACFITTVILWAISEYFTLK